MKPYRDAWLQLLNKGFGVTFKQLKLISCAEGKCVAEIRVATEHVNIADTLHGGLIATIIDHVTSFAILSLQYPNLKPSFSVNLNISYISKALINDELVIESVCEKMEQCCHSNR